LSTNLIIGNYLQDVKFENYLLKELSLNEEVYLLFMYVNTYLDKKIYIKFCPITFLPFLLVYDKECNKKKSKIMLNSWTKQSHWKLSIRLVPNSRAKHFDKYIILNKNTHTHNPGPKLSLCLKMTSSFQKGI
jgi:hypothetical protein